MSRPAQEILEFDRLPDFHAGGLVAQAHFVHERHRFCVPVFLQAAQQMHSQSDNPAVDERVLEPLLQFVEQVVFAAF